MLVICETCKKEFDKYPKDVKRCSQHYCSVECYESSRQRIKTQCSECKQTLYKTPSDYASSQNHFCTSSCAASFNNKAKRIGRKRSRKCKVCKALILSGYTYCQDCIAANKHIQGEILDPSKTLGYYKSKCHDMNKYRYIRQHATKVTRSRSKICVNCGYSVHVEVCHIKEIKSFPDTATLKEINAETNLVILCRRCHWELDHGLISPNAWVQ